MKSLVRLSAAALVLAGAAVPASAQAVLIERPAPGYVELSPAQRTVVYRYVVVERPVVAPPPVELRVGVPVPPAVELRTFPEEVYVEAPPIRGYRYFHVEDQVVLVDPETREIVDIIDD